jgi:adenylate cyclase
MMKTANLAIVFTDIKGFTERTSRQTLEQNQTLLRTHHDLLAPVFRAFSGRIIKEIGDAFLVTFESPTQAVLAGVALQDKLWAHNRGRVGDDRIDVRVAINAGEVRLENNDVFGEPVNIAARVEGLADAGDVYLTESVYLAMNKAEVPSEEVGLFELKGIPGKIRIFKVPHAPYRVGPVVAGTAAPEAEGEAPPYGNLGLAKMPEGSRAELTARAVELTAKAVHGGEQWMKRAGLRTLAQLGIAVLVLVLAGVGMRTIFASPLAKAVQAVEAAGPSERSAKIEAVRKLLVDEKDEGERQYWSGRLQEVRDDTAATEYYAAAIRLGHREAEERLISLLESQRCRFRVAALEVVKELKLKRAKGTVERLANSGGPDDRERLLFLGCNSKSEAAEVLRELE